MPNLTENERRSRRALDYRLVQATNGNGIVRVSAYESRAALERGRPIDRVAGEAGRADCYLAEYRFPVLVGPGKTTETTKVAFDVSGSNYPFSAPKVQVVSTPLPWSPHVLPGAGLVCIGDSWQNARGKMLLVGLVVHVARVLNCDEPDRGPGYVGWNAAAVKYWRDVLNRQPVNPGLAYPVLPVEITHGVAVDPDAVAFAPVESDAFAVAASQAPSDFIPREQWT